MSPELQVFIPTRYDIAAGFNTSRLDTIQLMQFTAARMDKGLYKPQRCPILPIFERNPLQYYYYYIIYYVMHSLLTIADTAPSFYRYSTILLLCAGSTRENSLAFLQASLCSSSLIMSNSRPENDFPANTCRMCNQEKCVVQCNK